MGGLRAAQFDAVTEFLRRRYIDAGRLAGAQIAIQYRGSLHRSCLGYADRERTRPLPQNALYRIFSLTKPITSVAFMMLAEEGRVALTDPVALYLPAWNDLRLRDGPASREMRIVDLLSHTSGLTYGVQYRTDIDAAYRRALSMQPAGQRLDEFVARLAHLPLEFEPGTAWNYSVATDVVGFLIEKISGLSLREFLRQRIFDPLRMNDTDFWVRPAERHRLAECYVHRPEELLGLPARSFETDRTSEPTFLSGGAGLISSVEDYLRFCNVILNRGSAASARLLSPATLALMSTNHLPMSRDLPASTTGLFCEPTYAGIGFGLGWASTIDAGVAQLRGNPGDAFWSGMANTFFWCDPSEELIVVFMTQLLPSETYPLQKQIRALVYDAIRT